jgi:hypothetical protein
MNSMNYQDIEREYQRLGLKKGWRFMTCPKENLNRASVALIDTHPGGTVPHGSKWSCEEGSAYEIESWDGHPVGSAALQVQVQKMCKRLSISPSELFSAHFVPFRSPSWQEMPRKKEVLAFSCRLWAWFLPRMRANKVICIGTLAREEVVKLSGMISEIKKFESGWGKQFIYRYKTNDDRFIFGLPHLSRFKLFSREESIAAFLNACSV